MCKAKDVKRRGKDGKPEAAIVGEGDVGFASLFERLVKDGYRMGVAGDALSEGRCHIYRASHRPMGYSFSEGGEEASIDCLKAWDRILKERGLTS